MLNAVALGPQPMREAKVKAAVEPSDIPTKDALENAMFRDHKPRPSEGPRPIVGKMTKDHPPPLPCDVCTLKTAP